MKVTILYSTRRGSTKKIVGKISEAFTNISIHNLSEEKPQELGDFIIIGTPIYYERPLPEILDFLEKNSLEDKYVAIFIVCMADMFSKLGEHAEKIYLHYLEEKIKGKIIDRKIFRGWILKENYHTLEEAEKWGKELYNKFIEAYQGKF